MSHNRLGFPTDLAGSRWKADETLVSDLQQGDLGAAEYVVQQYTPALYRYAYYQLQDAALAEDLVAEVMARMLQHIDSFVLAATPFEAWLFRIARNLIADHYRAQKRRPQISLEHWLAGAPGEEPGQCDERIDDLPEREVLRAGLASSPRSSARLCCCMWSKVGSCRRSRNCWIGHCLRSRACTIGGCRHYVVR